MKTNNIIIVGIVAILLLAVLVIGFVISTESTNNTTNDTSINITINNTNNTTENITTSQKTSQKTDKKSDEPTIVSEEERYNYQVDDGSYYRQVEYSDGNFRQYNSRGEIIGSSYDNDHVVSPSME